MQIGTEVWDTGSHWASGNPARLTVQSGEGGVWLIIAQVSWASNAVGLRWLGIELNSSSFIAMNYNNPGGSISSTRELNCSVIWNAAAGDYFRAICYQSSGGALNALATTHEGASLMMVRLSGT
ncbi:MAG: hypothetical protein HC804_12130 [Anaerolineae bacterium]|nr:hypothetical protein [Anaerolineae bacterium]